MLLILVIHCCPCKHLSLSLLCLCLKRSKQRVEDREMLKTLWEGVDTIGLGQQL